MKITWLYEKSLSFIAFVCALISYCGLATAIGIITDFVRVVNYASVHVTPRFPLGPVAPSIGDLRLCRVRSWNFRPLY